MNYIITVKGEASTDYSNLKELDGISCEDEFSDYFDMDTTYAEEVKGGFMSFKFENDILYTITTYDSSRELNEGELNSLMKYTQGQWSDGIGEGFEQNPCLITDDGEDVYISPWFYGQSIKISQKPNEY